MADANAALKYALAAALLLAGGSAAYYYGIHLPAQDVRQQALAMEEKQAAREAADRALQDRARREQAAQQEYDGCVALAESSYRERWARACEAQHIDDVAAFEDCADDLFSSRQGCLANRPIRPMQDCALPQATARAYGEARDTRKNECAIRLRNAQGSSATQTTSPGDDLQPPAQAPFDSGVGRDGGDSGRSGPLF